MSIKPLPVAVPVGISQPLPVVGADAMLQQVQSGIKGVSDRIKGLDLVTVPASFIGPTPAYVFKPEAASFDLDVFQWNDGTRPPQKVNYVVRSGTTYQLPILVGGNGVFLAHRFRINLWQRLYVNRSYFQGASQAVVSPIINGFFNSTSTTGADRVNWTTKFSCYPLQPRAAGFPHATTQQSPMMNYRWNIQDPVTGYNYGDNLMPASAILNRDYVQIPNNANEPDARTDLRTLPTLLFDGDWHEFDAPWRFDQAYQLNVMFRPITDIVQFDSSVDIGPSAPNSYMRLLPYDDRVSGIRDQSVYVQVEFQGERIGGSL